MGASGIDAAAARPLTWLTLISASRELARNVLRETVIAPPCLRSLRLGLGAGRHGGCGSHGFARPAATADDGGVQVDGREPVFALGLDRLHVGRDPSARIGQEIEQ